MAGTRPDESQQVQKAEKEIVHEDLAEELFMAKHAETMVELYNRIMADKGTAR